MGPQTFTYGENFIYIFELKTTFPSLYTSYSIKKLPFKGCIKEPSLVSYTKTLWPAATTN